MQTIWNTEFYAPPELRMRMLPVIAEANTKMDNGEIYPLVYNLVCCGISNVKELCHMLQRADQRVYNTLNALETAGYVKRTVSRVGSSHKTSWEACK